MAIIQRCFLLLSLRTCRWHLGHARTAAVQWIGGHLQVLGRRTLGHKVPCHDFAQVVAERLLARLVEGPAMLQPNNSRLYLY